MQFYTCPTLHSNRTQNMSQQCHLSMNCFLFHKRLCLHWDHNGVVFKRCLYYIFACSALSHFDSVWYNLCLILAVLGIRVSTQKWTNLDSFRQFPTYRSSQFKFFIPTTASWALMGHHLSKHWHSSWGQGMGTYQTVSKNYCLRSAIHSEVRFHVSSSLYYVLC